MAFVNFIEVGNNGQLAGLGLGREGEEGYLSLPQNWRFKINNTEIGEINLMVLSNFIQVGDEAKLNCNFNMNGCSFIRDDTGLIINAG